MSVVVDLMAVRLGDQGGEVVENIDVMWVPRNAVTRFIPVDTIFPPVLAVLEEQT